MANKTPKVPMSFKNKLAIPLRFGIVITKTKEAIIGSQ